MEEKKIYHEIPGGKNKFHSAILTSYSFNFHHFEYQVLKALKHKYITNIGILADADMLDKSVGMTSAGLQQLTQSYSINGVHCQGAFHPKINFIAGDDEALVIFGSGNISPSGHGKNHETFTALYADSEESKLLPVINESWEYIQMLAKDVQGFSKDRIITSIPKNCSLLGHSISEKHQFHKADDDLEIALVYNDETSIFSQVASLIPSTPIETISIVSPYFDEDGAFLTLLLESFPNAKLEVYIPKENGLPPIKLQPNARITFYTWEDTKRGQTQLKGNDSFRRTLHSKVFQFKSTHHNYFLIGSSNATIAGFGTMEKRGVNEEFGALYKSAKTDFFKVLDITKSNKIKSLSEYKRTGSIEIDTATRKNAPKIKLVACDVIGSRIKIFIKGSISTKDHRVSFFNDHGYILFQKECRQEEESLIIVAIGRDELIQNPLFIQLFNAEGEAISNKQIINFTEKLFHTDPSKENRTIRGLLGALEIGKINEFEILNYINDLHSSGTTSQSAHQSAGSSQDSKREITEHPEMTYAEAMNASKNNDLADKISQTHNAIRIWEVISQLFKEKEDQSTSELNDEEEDATVTSSKERTQSNNNSSTREITDDSECYALLRRTERLAHDYIKTLNKINADKEVKINEVHLCQFLLVTHILTAIHHFTDYELTLKKKKNDSFTSQSWSKTLANTYSTLTREILVSFSKFIFNHKEELINGNELRELKMLEYKEKVLSHILIYHFLINQNKADNPHSQTLDLVCLNIFDKLGLPDKESEKYIELVAKTRTTKLFNFNNVFRLKSSLMDKYENLNGNENYFREKHRGICLITERKNNSICYRSVFDPNIKLELDLKNYNKYKVSYP
jgi:hypothetical protein